MTANQIAAMLHTPSNNFQLHHMNIMKLSDSYDCDVFAIAIAGTINAWTHSKMRAHVITCTCLEARKTTYNPHENNSIFLDTSLVSMLRYVDGHEMAMGFGLSAASINGDVIHSVL